jgi:hypothetical protein
VLRKKDVIIPMIKFLNKKFCSDAGPILIVKLNSTNVKVFVFTKLKNSAFVAVPHLTVTVKSSLVSITHTSIRMCKAPVTR